VTLLTKILLLTVIAALLALLGVGGRGRGRISFPGPRIPESLITMFWLAARIVAYGAALWSIVRGMRGASRDDVRTAFALGFIGALMTGMWLHRRRTRRDAA
jgi:hypothetical protein